MLVCKTAFYRQLEKIYVNRKKPFDAQYEAPFYEQIFNTYCT